MRRGCRRGRRTPPRVGSDPVRFRPWNGTKNEMSKEVGILLIYIYKYTQEQRIILRTLSCPLINLYFINNEKYDNSFALTLNANITFYDNGKYVLMVEYEIASHLVFVGTYGHSFYLNIINIRSNNLD